MTPPEAQPPGEDPLLPQHRKLIEASAIDPAVAAARGYRSAKSKAELKRLGFSDYQCHVPALLIPVHSVRGNIATHQSRPDEPRIDKKSAKMVKYETPAGSRMVIDIPPQVRSQLGHPKVPLFITEGIRKADSAVSKGLCCIALLGVWNWRGKNEKGGKVALPDWETIALNGRKVYVVFDSDVMEKKSVVMALKRLLEFLVAHGAEVLVCYLPPGEGGTKVGLDDYFAARHTVADLLREASSEVRPTQDTSERPPEGCMGRLRFCLDQEDLHLLTMKAWEAIREADKGPSLFSFGWVPARLESSGEGYPCPRILKFDSMRCELVRLLEFHHPLNPKTDDERPARPPGDLISNLLVSPNPPLPRLQRVITFPFFGPDGTLIDKVGYHSSCELFLSMTGLKIPEVPEKPSAVDVLKAKHLLLDELLHDFPFDRPADLANAIALLHLPFVREMIQGPTPLHLIEKPTPGTGAGLLVDVLAIPALGRSASVCTEGRDEDEWRKRITAILMEGPTMVLIDNLRRPLDSAALSAALTAGAWKDRILGHSRMMEVPIRAAWVATANNPSVSHEIARRSVPIHLDAKVQKPWERPSGTFKHPHLRRWAIENRGDLIWAVLVLVRSWLAAGRPKAETPTLGSYEEWTEVIGGILAHAGIEGFLTNLSDFYERADQEDAAWAAFVGLWWTQYGDREVGTTELWSIIIEGDASDLLGHGSERAQRTRLGLLLRKARDRRYEVHPAAGETVSLRISFCGQKKRAAQYKLVQGTGERERTFSPSSGGGPADDGPPSHPPGADQEVRGSRSPGSPPGCSESGRGDPPHPSTPPGPPGEKVRSRSPGSPVPSVERAAREVFEV